MKKYTLRCRKDAIAFRLVKNVLAVGNLVVHATLTLTGHEYITDVVIATGISFATAVFGEVIFNGWMAAIETAESIQEKKNETI